MLSEVRKDHAGLAELLGAVPQHRGFAHVVDILTVFGGARFAVEEINKDRLPIGTDDVEH